MNREILIGGPGTGKTRTLVDMIIQRKPDNFAILTFTRQAANEAIQRLKQGGVHPKQMKYVRTIHSLAFSLLGLNMGQVVNHSDLMKYGEEYGFEFTNKFRDEEDGTYEGLTDDDIYFRLMNIRRITNREIEEVDSDRIDHMEHVYALFKEKHGLIDFTDMIIKSIMLERLPQFDLLCVDEVQDLAPIQYDFIHRLAIRAKDIIYAGDDDQMIYEWAGVQRDQFFKLAETLPKTILSKNYRVPDSIMMTAERVIDKCRQRIPKPIQGLHINYDCVSNIYDLSLLDTILYKPDKHQSILILARNNYFFKEIKSMLREMKLDYSYLHQFQKKPTDIKLSTIHGSKGAEADIVVLFDSVSPATYQNISNDSEHRVWYVGMTRARQQLYIVKGTNEYAYDMH